MTLYKLKERLMDLQKKGYEYISIPEVLNMLHNVRSMGSPPREKVKSEGDKKIRAEEIESFG